MFSLLFFINVISSNAYGFNLTTLRHSIFTATSLLTTTGFSTENFNDWPAFSNMLVFVLLFIGGSAGSTTGALKIIRTIVIIKFLIFEVKKLIHSKGVFNITLGKKVIDDDVVKATLGFYMFYIFIFIFTSLLLSTTGLDFITALSASASSIGNVGPGLGDIGVIDSWGSLNDFSKYLTSFCMILGRLEIFTIMVLFSRTFWKR
jgi:trk system potassium uptake protein TrkH